MNDTTFQTYEFDGETIYQLRWYAFVNPPPTTTELLFASIEKAKQFVEQWKHPGLTWVETHDAIFAAVNQFSGWEIVPFKLINDVREVTRNRIKAR